MAHSSRGCICCCILLLFLITQSHTIQPNGVEPEGCNGVVHGITCCSDGFTTGDNGGKQEMFIQANQYTATCANSCKQYGHSVGITESVRQQYSSGPGKNKNKCWCEFGEPKLNARNKDYRTCIFKLPLVSARGITTKAPMPPKSLMVSSKGSAATEQSEKLGRYELQDEFRNNFPVWKKEEGEQYLAVSKKQHWAIGPNQFSFGIVNYQDNPTPVLPHLAEGWKYFDGLDWKDDDIEVSIELELRGGSTAKEGNVFILNSNNTLVPVCDAWWGPAQARVVCHQLGYPDGAQTRHSHFGPVQSVHNDSDWESLSAKCYGAEARIQECKFKKISKWLSCTNDEGAGVICFDTTGPVILDGGDSPREGNVYTLNSRGFLRPVCDDNWGNVDARVVCRQLGYVDGTATNESYFGSVLDDFAMDNVNCNGTEARLQDCRYSKSDDCYGDEAAGVKCSNVTLNHSDEISDKEEPEIDSGCSSTQFACADGLRCIRAEFTCDEKPDCDDGSDEVSSLCMGVNSTQFACPYLRHMIDVWIPTEDKCNGKKDCLDNADEFPSECGGCKPTMFACANGKQCIPAEKKCDGYKSCEDGSDEFRSTCGDSMWRDCDLKGFACSNGWQCIKSYKKCDGYRDCEDGSDEFPSLCGPCDNSTQFACADGLQCILIENKCKRAYWRNKCDDGSDEIASTCGCKPGEFMCADGLRCIGARYKCNNYLDCRDASDESPSMCGGCKSEEFTCANGWQCVGAQFKCDGVKDCRDGSDEFAESPSDCGVPERRPAYSFHPNASAEYANYVELRGGDAPNKGNVFIAYQRKRMFGPLCDIRWNYDDARVVCRQLGYSDGIPHINSHFGPVNLDKVLDVNCERDPKYVQECMRSEHSNDYPFEGCGSSDGAGVTCIDDEDILLVGGNSSSEGNVYAKNTRPGASLDRNQRWKRERQGYRTWSKLGDFGSVCADGWGDEEATVACRQLGYGSGVAAKYPGIGFDISRTNPYMSDELEIYKFSMTNVNCTGNEQRIQDCDTGPIPALGFDCPSNTVAGVKCKN